MRDIPQHILDVWQSGDFTGRYRNIVRVTVQKANTRTYDHTFPIMAATQEEIAWRKSLAGTALALPEIENPNAKKSGTTTYASTVFGSDETPMELPNVKSLTWNRSVQSDVAEATFEFYNAAPMAIGEVPVRDEMGYYTFDRGLNSASGRWEHEPNEWAGMLVPDNILRSYEGYGCDPESIPERDPHLVQTGVWLIDQVDMGADGMIRVTARDLGRLLMDHISFLPVIPADFYPLSFKSTEKVSGEIPEITYKTPITVKNEEAVDVGVATTPPKPSAPVRGRLKVSYNACSDRKYTPTFFNYTIVPRDYLIKLARRFHVPGGWREIADYNQDVFQARGNKPKDPHWIYPGQVFKIPRYEANQFGHEPSDAFDSSASSYWLSHGFNDGDQGRSYAAEWIEAKVGNATVSQVRFTTNGSGYAVYVSVRSAGKWVGTSKIPYKAPSGGVDLDADIPYAKIATVTKSGREVTVTFDRPIAKVDRVRLTFKNLPLLSGRRRVALRNVSIYGNAAVDKAGSIVPVPPGYRGVTDTFDRKAGTDKGRPGISQLGKTHEGDQWIDLHYKISPRGSAARRVFKFAGVTATNDLNKSFPPAVVDLKVRQQSIRINTAHHPSTNDPVGQRDQGTWCVILRGESGGYLGGVKLFITKDGAISAHIVKTTFNAKGEGTATLTKVGEVAANNIDLTTKPYEIYTSLIGNELSVAMRPVGSVATPTLRLQIHDKRFADCKGTFGGFALGNYSAAVTYFKAQTRFRRGVHDSFTRKNSATLGRAETGQVWRHPANTWRVGSNDARNNTTSTGTPLALADMFDSDQETILDIADLGPAGQAVIALRAVDARTTLLVRWDALANQVRTESRIAGQTTVITTASSQAITQYPVKLKARIQESTITVTLDGQEVLSDTNLAYLNDAFSYHTGFGTKGPGGRIREFTGNSLGAPDTWIYVAETVVPAHFEAGAGAKPGTYEDYTDIVKLLCAWGGFYWPKDAQLKYTSESGGIPLRPQKTDPVLGYSPDVGRVWGDFEASGTAGPTPLDSSIWDKKTLMEGIAYVREILGFLFHIDETGGVIWRQPNIFAVGNNVASFSDDPRRTNYIYDIDETRTLTKLRTALNSRNVRERIFVANVTATQAGMSSGFNPNPTGLRRIAGWTDQHFQSQEECQVMADMIAIRQLFRYRASQLSIPALPALQIDDQVRIWERVTEEGHLHYIQGINSTNDMERGGWSYDLDTHWLGDDPFENWAFDTSSFPEETQAFMDALRARTGVGTTDYYELPRKDTDIIPPIVPSPDGTTEITEVIAP